MTEDLPIALRRARRSVAAGAGHEQPTPPQTPSRRSKRRGRFSGSGIATDAEAEAEADDHTHPGSSTGLTPFIRRTTLTPGLGSSKTRRYSGPAAADPADVFSPYRDTGYAGQVTFLPLRQVLDGRVKRRIRRNGLSEEMNVISAEKKRRTQRAKAEMDALRAEVAAKDAEIRRLSGETVVADEDDEKIDDLEREVERLRRNLNRPAPTLVRAGSVDSDATEIDWSRSTAGQQVSGDCVEMDVDFDHETVEDHVFSEDTIAELACSTPSRRSTDVRHSFPTPPSTSPFFRLRSPVFHPMTTPTSHASVQVQIPDPERQELEDELASLHLEVEKLTNTLETYEAMTSRLSDKLSPFVPGGGSAAEAILGFRSPTVKVEAQLNKLLKGLADRTTALADLHASLSKLGFTGTSASEIVTALSTAFRSARLELEYLEPGESTLPLTAAGAEVLDLLLVRLRELSRQNLENEDIIEEYTEAEESLRKQLGARVEAMDEMRLEIGTLRDKVKLRNMRIKELETGMDKLRATVKGYTRDISELESLAQRLEGDLDAAKKDLRKETEDGQEDVDGWLGVMKRKDTTVMLLEGKLRHALKQTADLKEQLAGMQSQQEKRKEEVDAIHQQHGSALASRDTRVEELREEVDKISEALGQAQETIQQLRAENGSLEGQLDEERVKAKSVFKTMRSEMERAVRMGQSLMATPPPNSPIGA